MKVDSAIRVAVRIVVGLLVNGQYDLVEAVTRGDLWSAAEIRRAVEQYGETLIHIPVSGWEELQVVRVDGAEPETFDVEIPLYSRERGRSDLWLSLQLIDEFRGAYATRLVNLRVIDEEPDLGQRLASVERRPAAAGPTGCLRCCSRAGHRTSDTSSLPMPVSTPCRVTRG